MTSSPAAAPHSFRISSTDLIEGSLNRPGTVRADKIYTLAQTIIVKKFGKVSPQIIQRIRQMLETVIKS
jgi:mRNA interferase MazF